MAKKKDNANADKAELLKAGIERARRRLGAIEDSSEGNPAARAARKRLKRAQRTLRKHENFRGVSLAKLAEKKAAQQTAGPGAGGTETTGAEAAAE